MLRARQVIVPPGSRGVHGHDTWHACAVMSGEFEQTIGARAIECEAGVARLSRPGARHELRFGPAGAKCLIILADGPFWGALISRRIEARSENRFGSIGSPNLSEIANSLTGLTVDVADLRNVGQLVAEIDETSDAELRPAWVEDAHEIILASPGDISLSELAAQSRVNRGVFAKRFQRSYGFRPVELRALIRLERSVDLIKSAMPLAEAALAAGYAHQSHLSNACKAILGKTPGQLRSELACV